MIVWVPKWIKCLVVGDTKVTLDCVGFPTSSLACPPNVLAAVKVPVAVQYDEVSTSVEPADKVVRDALVVNLAAEDASHV